MSGTSVTGADTWRCRSILYNPSFSKTGSQCTQETEYETEKPECIDTKGGDRRLVSR
jgi:hypothetical protein